jgi:uncharacterized phage infection (PIP) family protein YhgE
MLLLATLILLLITVFHILSRQINQQQQWVEQLIEFQSMITNLVIQQGQTISAFYGHFDQFITLLTPILKNQSVSLNGIWDMISNIIPLQCQVNHTLGQVADAFKGFKDVFQQQQNTLAGVQKTINSINQFQDRIRRLNAQVQAQQSTIWQARQESDAWRNHLIEERNDFTLVNNYKEWRGALQHALDRQIPLTWEQQEGIRNGMIIDDRPISRPNSPDSLNSSDQENIPPRQYTSELPSWVQNNWTGILVDIGK